jgi:hypothetical protein
MLRLLPFCDTLHPPAAPLPPAMCVSRMSCCFLSQHSWCLRLPHPSALPHHTHALQPCALAAWHAAQQAAALSCRRQAWQAAKNMQVGRQHTLSRLDADMQNSKILTLASCLCAAQGPNHLHVALSIIQGVHCGCQLTVSLTIAAATPMHARHYCMP